MMSITDALQERAMNCPTTNGVILNVKLFSVIFHVVILRLGL